MHHHSHYAFNGEGRGAMRSRRHLRQWKLSVPWNTQGAEGEIRRHPRPDDHDSGGARGGGGAAGPGAVAGRGEDLRRVRDAEVRGAEAGYEAGRRIRCGGGGEGHVPGAGVGRGGHHAGGRVHQGRQGGARLRRPLLAAAAAAA